MCACPLQERTAVDWARLGACHDATIRLLERAMGNDIKHRRRVRLADMREAGMQAVRPLYCVYNFCSSRILVSVLKCMQAVRPPCVAKRFCTTCRTAYNTGSALRRVRVNFRHLPCVSKSSKFI